MTRFRNGGGGFGAGFGFSDIMDAFFGGGQPRGPRPRQRRGQDALIRLELDLAETAFGATKEIQVDTAVGLPDVRRCRHRSRARRSAAARPAAGGARSSRCSARSSARS